jgi:hypothetical protein
VKLELVNAEVLTVGPDETLLIKFGAAVDQEVVDQIGAALERSGIPPDRWLIISGDVELAKVQT